MIDEREKPLSEMTPSVAGQMFVVSAGTEKRMRIDPSKSASVSARVEAGGMLSIIIAGAINEDITITRRIDLVGKGAKVELLAACAIAPGVTFRCDDDVRVSADGTECRIDDRCVAQDCSKVIVRQRVVVDEGIVDATIETSVRGMLLGSGARIRAIPELHIVSNAVKAKHAVAISRPSRATTAYFASRGIDPVSARTMIADQLLCPIGLPHFDYFRSVPALREGRGVASETHSYLLAGNVPISTPRELSLLRAETSLK
jgi:hypothetical protein